MKALRADELPPGKATSIVLAGRSIAIFNVEGTFHAIDNRCAHRGGPLAEGFVAGNVVFCPWHDWQFDVTTGACLNAPGVEIRSYSVSVQDGDVLVEVTGV